MKIWLPYVICGSGVDVFTQRLAHGLQAHGTDAIAQPFPHTLQYAPALLRGAQPPAHTDIIITNSWNGFAFHRPPAKLIVVEHHCVFDPAYLPYRTFAQGVFHDALVKRFERASFAVADRVIAVSHYTANSTAQIFPDVLPQTIHNGIDTEVFSPSASERCAAKASSGFQLFFVGNMSSRKGADLLAPIMERLGPGFQLKYTGGLRAETGPTLAPHMHPTGRLTDEQLHATYREADALLFPTRLEGFGYAAVEAMSCGLPVVATNGSSLPEIVRHGETGFLCRQDDIGAFAEAIRRLAFDDNLRSNMGKAARRHVLQHFDLDNMVTQYLRTCRDVLAS